MTEYQPAEIIAEVCFGPKQRRYFAMNGIHQHAIPDKAEYEDKDKCGHERDENFLPVHIIVIGRLVRLCRWNFRALCSWTCESFSRFAFCSSSILARRRRSIGSPEKTLRPVRKLSRDTEWFAPVCRSRRRSASIS